MSDVRDEALGAMLDRAATAIEAEPVDELPDVIRRGSRRRAARFTAIGAMVAVFVGAVSWAGLSLPDEEAVIPANVADWRTVGSMERDGWTMQVPPPWRVQELGPCPGEVIKRAVTVTNVDRELLNRGGEPVGCWEGIVWAGFPREGVILMVEPEIPWGLLPRLPVTPFPLTPDALGYRHQVKGGPLQTLTTVRIPGRTAPVALVSRWVGPDASAADVAALDRMLASLRIRGATSWIDDEITTTDEFPDLTIAIRYPESWRIDTYPMMSVMDAPNPLVDLRSPGIGQGRCEPLLAPRSQPGRFGEADLFVLISDATESWVAPNLGPRPEAFRLDDATELDRGPCGDVRTLRFGFEQAGRQLYVDVAVGEWFYRERPEMILEILDSIRVSRVPEG